MERCTLKVKDTVFTIPKNNLRILAMTKALDAKCDSEIRCTTKIETDEDAIKFLKSIGIEVI